MIYITIHDDSLEWTLKDMTVCVEDDGESDRVALSHRVQEKANELFTSWNIQRSKVMPDE